MCWPALHVDLQARLFRLAIVDARPCVISDDTQLWRRHHLPLVAWIRPRDSLPRVGVLHHPDLVPDDAPRIELVEDHAGAALRVAIDRRRVPAGSAWRRNSVAIEITR